MLTKMVVDECEEEWRLVLYLTGDDCSLHVALASLSWTDRDMSRENSVSSWRSGEGESDSFWKMEYIHIVDHVEKYVIRLSA